MSDADKVDNTTRVKNELASEERLRRQQIQTDAELFRALMAHPGWPRYRALIETVGQNFHQTIMKPNEDQNAAFKSEFAKGALNGLSLAVTLPSSKLKEAADLTPNAEDDE